MKNVTDYLVVVICLLLSAGSARAQFPVQIQPARPGGLRPVAPDAPAKSAEPDKPEAGGDVSEIVPRAVPPINPRQIRLHLMDGSVIAGELSVDQITVQTAFGDLTVPVAKIVRFNPGLDSYPELSAQVLGQIERLGSDDYAAREQAHKDLLGWGLKVRKELERFSTDANTERKRHVSEILKEMDELEQDQDEFDEQADRPWIRQDSIVTTEFTIVGRIAQDSFKITSKYGPLAVNLSDVQMADRALGHKAAVQKSLSVEGTNLVQRSFKSSGIRVEKGDEVTVRADGQVVMSPWGTDHLSTPDGGQTYGWYLPNEIPGGALVARIGSKGKVFKVGSRSKFTATSAGVIEFAVAMQPDYAGEGYNFPGEYKVRIKVQPK